MATSIKSNSNVVSLSNSTAILDIATTAFAFDAKSKSDHVPQTLAYCIMLWHSDRKRSESKVASLRTIVSMTGKDLTEQLDHISLALTGYSNVSDLLNDCKDANNEYQSNAKSAYNAKRAAIGRALEHAANLSDDSIPASAFNVDEGYFYLPASMYLAKGVLPVPGSRLASDKPQPMDGRGALVTIGNKVFEVRLSLAHTRLMAETRRAMNKRQPLRDTPITRLMSTELEGVKLIGATTKPADKPADKTTTPPTGATSNNPTGNLGVDGKPLPVPSSRDGNNNAQKEDAPGYKLLTLRIRDSVTAYRDALVKLAPIADITTYDVTPDGLSALNNAIAIMTLIRDQIITNTQAYDAERAAEVAKATAVAKEKAEQKARRTANANAGK